MTFTYKETLHNSIDILTHNTPEFLVKKIPEKLLRPGALRAPIWKAIIALISSSVTGSQSCSFILSEITGFTKTNASANVFHQIERVAEKGIQLRL